MKNCSRNFFLVFLGWAGKTSYLSSVPPPLLGSGRWREIFFELPSPPSLGEDGRCFFGIGKNRKRIGNFFWENNFFIFELNNSLDFFWGGLGCSGAGACRWCLLVVCRRCRVVPVRWAAWAIAAVPFGFGWLGFCFVFYFWVGKELFNSELQF